MRRQLRIVDYIKKHIYVQVAIIGVIFFTLAVIVLQTYLQNEYLRYLLEETVKTEEVVLDVSVVNVNGMLRDTVITGAEVAVDPRILSLSRAAAAEGETESREMLNLKTALNNIAHYKGEIAAVTIVNEDGPLCEYGRYWSGSPYGKLWKGENLPILEDLYQRTMEQACDQGNGSFQISTQPLQHSGFRDYILFHIAYPLVGRNTKKYSSEAAVVITYRLDMLVSSSAIGNTKRSENIVEYITDDAGRIIYYRDHAYLGESADELNQDGEACLEQKLNYFGWTVHTGIDSAAMRGQVHRMFLNGILVYVILLLICILVWQVVMQKILEPTYIIWRAMEQVRSGNLDSRIEIEGEHELWQLANEYNDTVDTLKKQRREIVQAYEEKMVVMERCNAAEMEALESQINAHFLFNTLGAINYSAIESGDTEVSELLKNLSNILYYSFSKKMKNVTLGEEMEWVSQYLYLQKFRLMDVFDYEISFPEEYSEWPCCKLFLQPFVENSIIHGFEGWDEGGKIEIIGNESGGKLCIQIMDNGVGIQPQVQEVIRQALKTVDLFKEQGENEQNQVGIGVRNCIARLRMYYGPELEADMESRPGFTCFTLRLPIPDEMLEEEGKSCD